MAHIGHLLAALAAILCSVVGQGGVETASDAEVRERLLLLTVATDETDGFRRFMRSCALNGVNVSVLGQGEEWRGGDIQRYPGGGQKINILAAAVEKYKAEKDLILLFTDSYDVIINSSPEEIIRKFKDFNARVVFSAEGFCWPDTTLASQYPRVVMGKRYLCSGGYIGYAADFHSVVTHAKVADTDDDQLYFTKQYLDPQRRKSLGMRLDHRSHIFQNLNGATEDIELSFDEAGKAFIMNSVYTTMPSVIHGNGPPSMKFYLNHLGNYLAGSWSSSQGCQKCTENTFSLKQAYDDEHPEVTMAVFVEHPVPFFRRFLERLERIYYPKNRMSLWIHCGTDYHEKEAKAWAKKMKNEYTKVTFLGVEEYLTETQARQEGSKECAKAKCSHYFSVDADAMLTNRLVLKRLVEQNRTVLAPLLVKPEKWWANFWGAVSTSGYYERSTDYIDIVEGKKRGVWNVPFISKAYLIRGDLLQQHPLNFTPISDAYDVDMAFSQHLREKGIFMYVSNREPASWGHLLELESFDTNHLHSDLYELFGNRWDWEAEYLHPNYSQNLNYSIPMDQPCPDVYRFPLMSEKFAKEMIEEVEHFGDWSGGKHNDKRLAGGYENVPTDDIHMTQIGFQEHYLRIIKNYIVPVQERVYPGFYADGKALLNFVVKYHPERQAKLRPHHDSSTFTTNVCLNRRNIDYEGGGCHFLRYNCSVTDSEVGWSLLHPGRLTHWHEGLETTKGTRYILVSFIDP